MGIYSSKRKYAADKEIKDRERKDKKLAIEKKRKEDKENKIKIIEESKKRRDRDIKDIILECRENSRFYYIEEYLSGDELEARKVLRKETFELAYEFYDRIYKSFLNKTFSNSEFNDLKKINSHIYQNEKKLGFLKNSKHFKGFKYTDRQLYLDKYYAAGDLSFRPE